MIICFLIRNGNFVKDEMESKNNLPYPEVKLGLAGLSWVELEFWLTKKAPQFFLKKI